VGPGNTIVIAGLSYSDAALIQMLRNVALRNKDTEVILYVDQPSYPRLIWVMEQSVQAGLPDVAISTPPSAGATAPPRAQP
jgi:biopolymer transport protein ExbD